MLWNEVLLHFSMISFNKKLNSKTNIFFQILDILER